MKRHKLPRGQSKKLFTATADRTKAVNTRVMSRRGGIRF